MIDNSDFKSDIENWAKMWDELQEIEGSSDTSKNADIGDADIGDADIGDADFNARDLYYDCLEPELLQESDVQNPIHPESLGKDQDNPEPSWVNEDLLKEIESLKNKLFELENSLAKKSGEWAEKAREYDQSKISKELIDLRDKIDKLSDRLGTENETSPWDDK